MSSFEVVVHDFTRLGRRDHTSSVLSKAHRRDDTVVNAGLCAADDPVFLAPVDLEHRDLAIKPTDSNQHLQRTTLLDQGQILDDVVVAAQGEAIGNEVQVDHLVGGLVRVVPQEDA